ncbi:MAG: arginine--tRNA ligase, partial [Candidatus Latescibacteria bacterium]|nr:arginine--tRNA ligase [Candidatus Latescibacterota bacterium]
LRFPPVVTKVTQVGPYLNFKLDRAAFATALIGEAVGDGDSYGSDGSGRGRRVLLEHTSINPNASPHIGRARNGLIGDAIARLFRFQGYDVDVHYYVNDMGKQIGLLALQVEGREEPGFDDILEEYVAANARASADPSFEAKGLDLLRKMEDGDPDVKATFTRLVDICLGGQLAVLGRLGLSYNTFDRESSFLHDRRMAGVMRTLEEKGALFTDGEGRKVLDLAPLGYGREEGRYVVMMRANGSSMYMYRDIAYTLEKIERASGANIIVLGEDHKMYFEQLSTIIRAVGKVPPEAVHYAYILLREGKMSTRQGTVVLLSDFLDEVTTRALERVEEQWPGLPADERAEIARIIGIGAVRFTILSVKPNRNVIFDWDTALSFTGDSGPYVQYSCTRIASILRKSAGTESADDIEQPAGPYEFAHDAEWNLVVRLARVEMDVAAALDSYNPAVVANTALDIARRFSVFYTACPVLAAESDAARRSRIALCMAVRRTLMNLLGLLGIEAPERM